MVMAYWRYGIAGGAVEFLMKMKTSETFYFVHFAIIKCTE